MIRALVALTAVMSAIAILAILNLTLPGDSAAGRLLVDKGMEVGPGGELVDVSRPFSVQSFMWVAFMLGMGEVILRLIASFRERAEMGRRYLPEGPDVLLSAKDLVPCYRRLRESGSGHFLPRLIEKVILQYQTSKSVDRASSVLTSSLDLFMHELDLRYNLLRFFVWIIPSLGFLGTVVGIISGLNIAAAQYKENMGEIDLAAVTDALGVAFYTTWLGLIMASILVLLMHIAVEIEERALNKSAEYCIDHLINKLYDQ